MVLGEMAALGDAVCWSGVGVATKRLGRAVRPVHVTSFLATVSALALVLIATLTGQMDDVLSTPARSLALFSVGAVVGALGMLLFFVAVSTSGVGATYTTTSGLYILFSLVAGIVFLDEGAGPWAFAGAAGIIAGLYVLNRFPLRAAEMPPEPKGAVTGEPPRVAPRIGGPTVAAMGLAAVTAALWTIDLIASKEGLRGAGLLANGLVHQMIPAALFGGYVLVAGRRMRFRAAPADRWRLAAAAALYIGSTLTWNFALANAEAGVTALLASTSPVFALLLAGVVLRERLSKPALLGAALAFAGIVTVVGTR